MLRHEQITVVIEAQKEAFLKKDVELTRETLNEVPVINSYATMITGIRRCGKSNSTLILSSLIEDILIRDIAVRHGVRDVASLKQLAVYLISSTGDLVSANKLTGIFGIKSTAIVLVYFSYFKDAYLMEFMPQFSYSLKAQARNPKKIYAIDTGLIAAVSTAFTDDAGHRLENLVYLPLRLRYKELYYFKEKGECDFVVFSKGKAVRAVQVCYQIEDTNFEREYNGLMEAMQFLSFSKE